MRRAARQPQHRLVSRAVADTRENAPHEGRSVGATASASSRSSRAAWRAAAAARGSLPISAALHRAKLPPPVGFPVPVSACSLIQPHRRIPFNLPVRQPRPQRPPSPDEELFDRSFGYPMMAAISLFDRSPSAVSRIAARWRAGSFAMSAGPRLARADRQMIACRRRMSATSAASSSRRSAALSGAVRRQSLGSRRSASGRRPAAVHRAASGAARQSSRTSPAMSSARRSRRQSAAPAPRPPTPHDRRRRVHRLPPSGPRASRRPPANRCRRQTLAPFRTGHCRHAARGTLSHLARSDPGQGCERRCNAHGAGSRVAFQPAATAGGLAGAALQRQPRPPRSPSPLVSGWRTP